MLGAKNIKYGLKNDYRPERVDERAVIKDCASFYVVSKLAKPLNHFEMKLNDYVRDIIRDE